MKDNFRLLDAALNTEWLMSAEKVEALKDIYFKALALKGVDIESKDRDKDELYSLLHGTDGSLNGRAVSMSGTSYARVVDQIAILDLTGPIFPRASMMTNYSGAVSMSEFVNDFVFAYKSEDVKGIVINIDCPGGDVRGIPAGSDIIHDLMASGKKPVMAFSDGLMASGGYYVGAAVGKGNLVGSKISVVGSIGVVTQAQKGPGDTIEITSTKSPYKRIDANTDEGKQRIVSRLDTMAEVFLSDVARYRGVEQSHVEENYGQGDVLVGSDALKAGLIDSIGTLESTVAEVKRRYEASAEWTSPEVKTEESDMKIIDSIQNLLGTDTNETSLGESKVTREELEERFTASGELFALEMVNAHKIFPAHGPMVMCELVAAMADDSAYGGDVAYTNSKQELVRGTRADAVKARYANLPSVAKLEGERIASVDSTEETDKVTVLKESKTDVVDKESITPTQERVATLLEMTAQGRAASQK